MIKKYWVYILFGIAVILFVISGLMEKNKKSTIPQITYKTYYTDSLQWGYDIYVNNQLRFHQNIIPGASGKKGFVSEEQAATIARLVINKMKNHQAHFPTVTNAELDSCGITR
ncbi:DUF4907 domain-containing protein [Hydrotalea sp.]|uniref:DUF4907 domain-containing protein n=2 Tax=Hydrotalea sp. TaxID=2881279 RepID=UPI00261C0249|nr:DUF4907 domain-containing protein [Hydrotalea sp.]